MEQFVEFLTSKDETLKFILDTKLDRAKGFKDAKRINERIAQQSQFSEQKAIQENTAEKSSFLTNMFRRK